MGKYFFLLSKCIYTMIWWVCDKVVNSGLKIHVLYSLQFESNLNLGNVFTKTIRFHMFYFFLYLCILSEKCKWAKA